MSWADYQKELLKQIVEMDYDKSSDYHKSFEEIVAQHDFDFEEYEVETEDGYLLTVFRIRSGDYPKPAVFLQHGIGASADCWVNH